MESNKLLKYLEIVKFAQVENELSKHFELRDSGQFDSHFFFFKREHKNKFK